MKLFKNIKEVEELIQSGEKLVIYNKKVLDTKSFKHPGPQELIEEYIGKDMFKAFEKVGHSDNARRLIQEMTIGEIAEVKEEWVKLEEPTQKEKDIVKFLDQNINPE